MNRPNIVFILSDDQGPWAAGCYGNAEIRTPAIDRIAQTGMRFDNFFVATPVCSPSRATFLTGRIPSQHGVHDWIREGNVGDSAAAYLAGEVAYTDILADNGWVCGLSGKWHLGHSQLAQHGFSHWYVHQQGGGPYNDAPMIRDGELITEPGYVTTAITNDALAFIDQHADGDAPFYLGVHYTAPHSPWTGHPQEIVDSYDNCAFDSCPQEAIHPWAVGHALSENCLGNREMLKGYFAAVTAMDRDIGRILDKLEEKGLREDTLVVFTSDNGFSCGHHGFWGKGNGTYPPNMYENSIKVPFVVSHPSRIPTESVQDGHGQCLRLYADPARLPRTATTRGSQFAWTKRTAAVVGRRRHRSARSSHLRRVRGDADDAHRGVEIRPPLSRWAARTLRPSQRPGRARQSGETIPIKPSGSAT